MNELNSVYKKAQSELDVSVYGVQPIDLKATFSTQDENTALLHFVVKKDGVRLPLSEPAKSVIYLVGNQLKVKKDMEVDRANSTVSYLLTPEEVKHYGKVDGEVYIHYNNEGKQSLSVHKFSFHIEQALIDQDLDVIENVYISDLEDIKSEYLDQFENLKTELKDKVAKLQTDTTQLQKDAKELEEKFNAIDPDQFVKETGDTVSGTLTFLNEGEKQVQISPSGVLVNGYDVYTKEKPVQEFPLTDTAGKLLFKANVDFDNLDASFESSFVGYVTTSTNVPFGLNPNGYFTLRMRTSGYATATFQPYNSNTVIVNRREGVNGWKGWAIPPVDLTQVQPLTDEALSAAKQYVDDKTTKTIWTGGYHMVAAHTVTPSIPLNECKAWILYWSKYSGGAVQDYYWCTQVVTKETLGGHKYYTMMDNAPVEKYIYISNTQIKGSDDNNKGTNGQAVMRKVVAIL